MQKDFLSQLKEMDNYTVTENGAIAYNSTGNNVLDAFSQLGACQYSYPETILDIFYRALNDDKNLSMKLLFYIRDVRGGQGMRRVFRVIARSIAFTNPDLIINNLDNFLFFGRGDDLLCLIDTPVEKETLYYITSTLNEDLESVTNGYNDCTLLAKWMPSENASSETSRLLAKKIRKSMGLSSKKYRVMLSILRKHIGIVESKMSSNNWNIEFENVPSKASILYSNAFLKHNYEGYSNYLTDVAEGKSKINAGTLFPVDIVSKVLSNLYNPSVKDTILYDVMWNSLPNYFEGKDETGICVVDTSGSMNGKPFEVALSLGLYCADKCKGPFRNHFITFSGRPKLQEIKGVSIYDKVRSMTRSEWMMNTDIEKVFRLILDTALINHTPQTELPNKLYIISDMQFDKCAYPSVDGYSGRKNIFKPKTLIENMSELYNKYGYTLPALVFWNVRESDCGMFQKLAENDSCCMVSGYSSSLFESVINGTDYVEEKDLNGNIIEKQKIDPLTVMTRTLNSERYNRVYTGV